MKASTTFQLSEAISVLTEAKRLIAEGLPCFPCTADKRPTTSHGFKDAATDAETLDHLWRRYPGVLIGVPTGEPSDLAVLDIDGRHAGGDWYAEHRARLPRTRAHRTRNGGLHLFFRHRTGLRCSAGRIAPGVDVRAGGGYVIWWPVAGLPVLSEVPPAPWPEWLLTPVVAATPAPPRLVIPDDAALMRLVRTVAGAQPGERNNLAFWASCRVGEMIGSGLLSPEAAVELVTAAATRAGVPSAEARRTAWSGIRRSGGTRRG